ncbi:hypothetical protein, partial [Rothia nasisuis]
SEAKMQRPQGTESAARRAPIAWISKDFSRSEKESLAHLASLPARSEPGEKVGSEREPGGASRKTL